MTSSEPTPDSQDPSDGLKELKNFYNQRTLNLSNFPPSLYSRYSNNRGPLHKPRSAYSNSTSKSLNVLRSALQKKINEDIKQVMQKYIEIYFRPAIANLRKNFGNNTGKLSFLLSQSSTFYSFFCFITLFLFYSF